MPAVAAILHIGIPPRPISQAYAMLLERRAIAGDWLVQAPAIGLKLAFAYNPDGTWEHRLLSLGDIAVQVPPGGGIAAVANVTLQIAETGTGQSLIQLWEATGTVNGIEVTIDFLGEGETTPLRMMTGSIDSITVHNAVSEVLIVDSSIQKNVLLPKEILDQVTYPAAAQQVWGHRAPLVYGQGSHGGRLPLQGINIPTKTYLVAGHPMATGGNIAVYNQDTATYMGLVDTSGVQVTTGVSATTLTLRNPPQDMRFNVQQLPRSILAAEYVSGPLQAIDSLSLPPAWVFTSGVDSNLDGIGQLVVATNASDSQRGNNTVIVDFANHRRALDSDPTVTGLFTVRTLDPLTGTTLRDGLLQTQQYRHSLNAQTTSFLIPSLNLGGNEQLAVRLVARNEGGPGNIHQRYEIGEITIESYYQPTGDVTLYLTGSAWVGRTDPDGTVTSYFTTLGAGTVLTQPDQIIASLLVQECGLTLDEGWFSLAYMWYRSQGWIYDGGMGAGWGIEGQNVREALGQLAMQAGSILVPTFEGGWGLRVYRTDVDAVLAFDLTTILCTDGTTPATLGEQRQSSMVISLGNLEQVANRFEVRYGYNPGTGTYDQTAIASTAGCTVGDVVVEPRPLFLACLASHTNYGLLEPRAVDASWIQDATTAARLLAHLVFYFTAQRVTITFDTTFRALQLQVGDYVRVNYPLLPASENGQKFEVHALKYSPMNGRVTITASRLTQVTFEYFALQDSFHVIWYFWLNQAGELTRDTIVPSVTPFTATRLFPGETPYSLQVLDSRDITWFLYPNTLGELATHTTAPTGLRRNSGTGQALRGIDQHTYTLGITTIGETQLTQT